MVDLTQVRQFAAGRKNLSLWLFGFGKPAPLIESGGCRCSAEEAVASLGARRHFGGMFVRRHRKIVSGESYEYWTLCESRRTAAGPRQRVVATLGKLTGEEPLEEAGWEQLDALLDGKPSARQMQLGEPAARTAPGPRWELVDVHGVRVERARDFGEAFSFLGVDDR